MKKTFLLLALLSSFALTRPATAADPVLTIATRDSQVVTMTFSGFDEDRLTFELKLGKQEREINLRDIALVRFNAPETAPIMRPPAPESLDVFSMLDGSTRKGIFRHMDSEKVYTLLLEDKLQDRTLQLNAVRQIALSPWVLDVDRRVFGGGFNLFGTDTEVELANGFAADIEQDVEPLSDPAINTYVNQLGKKIAAASKRPDLDYRFKVLNSNQVNAFTVGGGKVYVYRGLLQQMNNESELAGVLAHEIGHNVGKHSVRELSKSLLMAGILSATGELIKTKSEQWASIFQQAGGAATYFAGMKFSRDQEREADYLAVYDLYQQGYDPHGMVSLFETLKNDEGREPTRYEVFFQTHPKLSERIDNTAAEVRKLRLDYLKKDSPEFQSMKQHLAELPPPITKRTVATDTLVVEANHYATYKLPIDKTTMKSCVLKGSFVAHGGSGNDIKVFVFDEVNFLNWTNNHQATPAYESGLVTAGELSVALPETSTYYLVFDNTVSVFAGKWVVLAVREEFVE